jgi:hypothetical protein
VRIGAFVSSLRPRPATCAGGAHVSHSLACTHASFSLASRLFATLCVACRRRMPAALSVLLPWT